LDGQTQTLLLLAGIKVIGLRIELPQHSASLSPPHFAPHAALCIKCCSFSACFIPYFQTPTANLHLTYTLAIYTHQLIEEVMQQ